MKRILIRGTLISLPILITIYVLVSVFTKIDAILQPLIYNVLGVNVIGLGFALVVIAMFIVGLVGGNTLGKWFIKQGNRIIHKVPIANKVYGGVSEVVGMIGDSEKSAFSKVVRVEFPMVGVYSLGFVTNEKDNEYTVMIPTTPNPSNGFMIMVEKDKCEVIDIAVDKALKIIVSMGVLL